MNESDIKLKIDSDVENVVDRFNGNKALCKSLIIKYIEKNFDADLNNAFVRGNIDDILEILHAAKGSSGNMGLNTINEIYKDLEYDIKKSGKIPADYIKILNNINFMSNELKLRAENLLH